MKHFLLLTFLICQIGQVKADLFGGDIGVLIKLATTSIKQLNEMEKLVSNAEKHTQRVQKYNEVLQDKILFANQVLYKLEGLKRLQKGEIKNLSDINSKIRQLKWRISDFKRIIARSEIDLSESKEVRNSTYKVDKQARTYQKLADQQLNLSGGLQKNVSLNKANALTNAHQLRISGMSLEVQNQNLHQNATQAQYVIKNYEEKKLKQAEFEYFWLGNTKRGDSNDRH